MGTIPSEERHSKLDLLQRVVVRFKYVSQNLMARWAGAAGGVRGPLLQVDVAVLIIITSVSPHHVLRIRILQIVHNIEVRSLSNVNPDPVSSTGCFRDAVPVVLRRCFVLLQIFHAHFENLVVIDRSLRGRHGSNFERFLLPT